MLEIQCDKCGKELQKPGALIFSPPTGDGWLVEKYHLCADCWLRVAELINRRTFDDGSPNQ
jgi:hypothetical protein